MLRSFSLVAYKACMIAGIGKEIFFTLQEAWRGVSSRQVSLLTGRGGSDRCITFEPGELYVVYAYARTGDRRQASICSRTRKVAYENEDLKSLRQHANQQLR